MIEELEPYESYQATELPWARRLPAHWNTKRGKAVLAESMLPTSDDQEIVTCFRDGQVTLRRNRRTSGFMVALYEQGYQGVRKGQLVVHAMDAFAGAIGISDSDGKCTPEYVVCNARGPSVHLPYVAQALRVAARDGFILASCPSVRERAPRFRWANLGDFLVPLPPPDEQAAIVRFLDHANRRIDQFIRAKKKLVALLNEQKQAIIHRAVTRGLDPNVKLKDSGVPWLGEVPAHWSIQPIKHLLARMDYGTSENSRREGKVRVLTMGHIKNARIQLPKTGALESVPPGLLLERNDLLFNRTNSPDLVGKVGLFEGDANDEVTFASYLVRLRVRQGHRPSWMNYLLNSPGFWGFARSQALVSLHQANLNSTRYARMLVPVPPSQEQQLIVEHIERVTEPIDASTTRAEREIGLMREYRTRLVADVVTGQLDVRAPAAALPDLEPQIVVNEPSEDEEIAVDEGEAA